MKLSAPVGISLFLLINFSSLIKAQSMRNLFMMLPDDATPNLNHTGRKDLIKEGEYAIKAHREEEIDYTIDTVTDDYLSYEYSIGTGTTTNITFEIRKFKIDSTKNILFYTTDGDVTSSSSKHVFKAYDICKDSVSPNYQYFIPDNLNYSYFIKIDTPDSVRKSIAATAFCSFVLNMPAKDEIGFRIIPRLVKDRLWLKGNYMVFKWNGKMFVNSIIFSREDE